MPLDDASPPLADHRQMLPLAEPVQHRIDNLREEDSLDEGSYLALTLFASRPATEAMVLNPPMITHRRFDLAGELPPTLDHIALAQQLLDQADATLNHLPQHVFDALAYASLTWLRRDLMNFAEFYADWAFRDEIVGGCSMLRRDIPRLRPDGSVWPRTMRRLMSPAFINRYTKREDNLPAKRALANRILDRVARANRLSNDFASFAEELTQLRERKRAEDLRQFAADIMAQRDQGAHQADQVRVILKKEYRRRRPQQRERAIVKRALKIAERVLPEADLRLLMRGEPIRLPGKALDLQVAFTVRAVTAGHGVLDVRVIEPWPGTNLLAILCVYYEKLPAIDQVVALALAMAAGEEAEVIHDANITMLMPKGREHPLLAARERKALDGLDDGPPLPARNREDAIITSHRGRRPRGNGRVFWDHGEETARRGVYWEATKHIWIDRVATHVCGRRVKLLTLEAM